MGGAGTKGGERTAGAFEGGLELEEVVIVARARGVERRRLWREDRSGDGKKASHSLAELSFGLDAISNAAEDDGLV